MARENRWGRNLVTTAVLMMMAACAVAPECEHHPGVAGAIPADKIPSPTPTTDPPDADPDPEPAQPTEPDENPRPTPTAPTETDGVWALRGMGGGGALYSPSISPFDSNELYLATDMLVVFRSGDFGQSWSARSSQTLQGGVDSEVRFTSDPQVLYALDLSGELRRPVRSDDAGKTWAALAAEPGDPSERERQLHVDPDSTERLILWAYDQLFFSGDGGASFGAVYTTGGAYEAIGGGVVWDGDRIFAGTSDGLVVSTDGGQTFGLADATGLPPSHAIISLAGARQGELMRLYAITAPREDIWFDVTPDDLRWAALRVHRLDWGATGWVAIDAGIEGSQRPLRVATARGEPEVVWIGGTDMDTYAPVVLRSTNGGDSWTNTFQTEGNANIATGWSGDGCGNAWTFGEYVLGLAVAPKDPSRAVITDLGFAHVTSDGGATWQQAYAKPSQENSPGQACAGSKAYAGNGLENTSSWWVHRTSAGTLLVAQADVAGMRSLDGGETWTAGRSLGLDDNSTYHVVEDPSSGALYAATATVHDLYQSPYLADWAIDGGDGRVMRSVDDGASWTPLWQAKHPVVALALDHTRPDTMYASVVHSQAGGIYVTSNLSLGANATWTRLPSPTRTEGHPFEIEVLDDGTLISTWSGRRVDSAETFTQSSGIFVSADGGQTWEDRSSGEMTRWTKDLTIDPHDGAQSTWYVSVFSHWGAPPNELGGLYRTTDRGLTWSRVSDLYRVESATVDPGNPEVAYLTTEAQGLWRTSNLSAAQPTFTRVEEYPFLHPTRVFFDKGGVWVTSFGGGVRLANLTAR